MHEPLPTRVGKKLARIIVRADDGTEYENVKISSDIETYESADELLKAMPLITKALFKALAQDQGRDPRLY
jgi:hypothetical protein